MKKNKIYWEIPEGLSPEEYKNYIDELLTNHEADLQMLKEHLHGKTN